MVLMPVAFFRDRRIFATGALVMMVRFDGASSRYAEAVVREPLYMYPPPIPIPIRISRVDIWVGTQADLLSSDKHISQSLLPRVSVADMKWSVCTVVYKMVSTTSFLLIR